MANNRMSLRCDVCGEERLLAKYYPRITDGWFLPTYPPDEVTGDTEFVRALAGQVDYCHRVEDFLTAHSYCDKGAVTMYGNRKFSLVFEVPDGP